MTPTNTEALAASLIDAAGDYTEWCKQLGYEAAAELRRLAAVEAERDALRVDAERYRWLRDARMYSAPHGSLVELWIFSRPTATAGAIDAAIDAAMKGTQA